MAHKAPAVRQRSIAVHYYLTAYNILSALGWSAIFIITTLHLAGLLPSSNAIPLTKSKSIFSSLFPFNGPSGAAAHSTKLPSWLRTLLRRAETTHLAVGFRTKCVQSAAALEVVHVLRGWIKSPLNTTAMQVASRLFIVWVVLDKFEAAQRNPLYASLVLSWSLTEAIRYTFYALSLLPPPFAVSHALLLARYSTFFVLYPTGALSEAFLNLATVPGAYDLLALRKPSEVVKRWGVGDVIRLGLFLVWWPGLYVMYTYMIDQRRKVLSNGQSNTNGVTTKKKTK